jgi:uroporphyrinogen-III synthase
VLSIQTLADADSRERLQAAVTECDEFIFVSRNAVAGAVELLPDLAAQLAGKAVYATGAATRGALLDAGVTAVRHTDAGRASEGLLALPELAPDRIRGRSVAIVRGEDGRELLPEELQRRGADVRCLATYRRSLPQPPPETVNSLWQDNRPDVIVITSVTGLHNLVHLTPIARRPLLFATRLVVISERIAGAARELGFTAPAAVAEAASDPALCRAIEVCMESSE